jgi:hypothetical protein
MLKFTIGRFAAAQSWFWHKYFLVISFEMNSRANNDKRGEELKAELV